ncbi:MAG: alkaline phosphatase D family protein [Ilumatobacteraceae bacterium]
MHPITRRAFLAGGAAVVAAACSDSSDNTTAPTSTATTTSTTSTTEAPTTTEAATTTSTSPAVELGADPFTLGVASGDPDAASVVLWTRLAPDPLNGGGMPADDIDVTWEVSDDASFATIASSGTETAIAERAHTVHVVVAVDQGSWFFRFRVGQYTSPIGATRAAPDASVALAESTFAVANCQNYANGQYAAHRDLAQHKPDFVVWLGDYIYEDAAIPGNEDPAARVHLGPEPTTLVDYRNRYARYKSDEHLQAAHAVCPWFVIWDDHEVENNYAGETPQDPGDAPTFPARRFAAYQAWWEHQPVRLDPPAAPDQEYRTYREVHWGKLIDLVLLDGRQYRTDQACGDITLSLDPPCDEVQDPARTMLGDTQEQWVYDVWAASTATWNVVGNQVVFADATLNGAVLNFDQWDGYPVERARILQHLADSSVPNVVVLTGDIHLAAVAQLRAGDRATGPVVGAEFITTSISSDGLISDQFTDVLKSYPHLVDAELTHRGYALHTVTPDHWTAEYRIVADVSRADSEVSTLGTYGVVAGTNTVTKLN